MTLFRRPPALSLASLLASIVVVVGSAAGLLGGCDGAETFSKGAQHIVNGDFDEGHPAVGALLSEGLCTATLVGKRTILTAAHCVQPGRSHTFVIDDRRITVDRVTRHPLYNGKSITNDVAVARLRSSPAGITPARVGISAPKVGDQVTLVGLGQTSNQGGSGFKRKAVNAVWRLTTKTLTYRGAAGTVGNLCYGDSGGPSFALINGQDVQVGIHSYGIGVCGQQATDMRVDAYLDFIKQAAEGDVLEGGYPDTKGPNVSFVSPEPGATVLPKLTIECAATDDIGVVQVELFVDAKSVGRATAKPYLFDVQLASGERTLEAVATDVGGNTAKAQLSIKVQAAKGFGAACSKSDECETGLCAVHPALATKYCTQACDPKSAKCPGGVECARIGATFKCEAPASLGDSGGCNAGRPPSSSSGSALLLGLLALVGLARRTRGSD